MPEHVRKLVKRPGYTFQLFGRFVAALLFYLGADVFYVGPHQFGRTRYFVGFRFGSVGLLRCAVGFGRGRVCYTCRRMRDRQRASCDILCFRRFVGGVVRALCRRIGGLCGFTGFLGGLAGLFYRRSGFL